MDFVALGCLVALYAVAKISDYLYRKMLVEKADAPKSGQSNVVFILGKPYVIMHEKDFIEKCNPRF